MPRNGFRVITLCGSMRFAERIMFTAEELSKEGVIVLAPFVVIPHGQQATDATKDMLDRMHFAKILMSDAIGVVLDETGYRGESTRNEIRFARLHDKPVNFYVVRATRGGPRPYMKSGEWNV